MICTRCGVETKEIRMGGAPYYLTPVCRLCRRIEDGRAWRFFKLLRIIGLYK